MNKIKYLDDDFHSREDLIRHYFFVYQGCSFNEYIINRKYDLDAANSYCKNHNLEAGYNDYLILKQEIEEILKRRDPLEIVNLMRTSNDNEPFKDMQELEKHCKPSEGEEYGSVERLERIYYEFYHEDENFRLDLIETPIKELKAIPFG